MTFLPPDKQTFPGQVDPADAEPDLINHPPHYTEHPSGVEMSDIAECYSFCLGNVIKYVWRAGLKDGTAEGEIEDLKKARWYLEREIERLEKIPVPSADAQVRVSGVPYSIDQRAFDRMTKADDGD